jgi:hypothetical protein
MAMRRQRPQTSEATRPQPMYNHRAVGLSTIGAGQQKKMAEAISRRAPMKTTPQQRASQHGAVRLPPSAAEVVAAVESLYADQLKPYGRILRKRLSERAAGYRGNAADGDSTQDVDIRQLRNVCNSCPTLRVEDEEGGDWSAVLVNRAQNFVDIYSPYDDYSEELWTQASAYFEGLSGDQMTLPGGRYACAQVLVARNLPFLKDCTLGNACHIVQLAISQKKVLGYLNGSVVPYFKSQSMVKERCATEQTPCAGPGRETSGLPLADWDMARRCLADILETAAASAERPGQPGTVPLSNVKRLFRSRFNVELSETTLGHSKLSELLQDEQFADVCQVKLEGHGYIVVQNTVSRSFKKSQFGTPPMSYTSPALSYASATTAAQTVDHFHQQYLQKFSAMEPAKVFLGANVPFDPMMCRPRPPPLSEHLTLSESTDEEDCYLKSVSAIPTPLTPLTPHTPPPKSTAAFSDSSTMIGDASQYSTFPSPASAYTCPDMMISPSRGHGPLKVSHAHLLSNSLLPPPPLSPPPAPPGLFPLDLSQVRAPPGLTPPPGLAGFSKNMFPLGLQELCGDFHEVDETSPTTSAGGSGSAPGSSTQANDAQRVLCLSNHV